VLKPPPATPALSVTFSEFAVAEIVVERVAPESSDVDILQAVVVEVGDSDAHAPAFARRGRPTWSISVNFKSFP